MNLQGFADLTLHGEHRVQGGHGLLEDHGDLVAADVVHLLVGAVENVFAVEGDAAAFNIAVAVQQLDNAHGGHALAGAGLTYNAQGFAGVQGIGHVVDGLDNALFRFEIGVKVLYFQQTHRAHLSFDLGSMASRRPSPTQLMLMVQMPSAKDGNTHRHQ